MGLRRTGRVNGGNGAGPGWVLGWVKGGKREANRA